MNESRENQLNELIEKIDNEGKWIDDYNTDNTDNPYADYCMWGHTESELNLDYLDDDVGEIVEKFKTFFSDDRCMELELVECCNLSYEPSYRSIPNEIFSCRLGEIQTEYSDDLKKSINELMLTDEDREYLRRNSDYFYNEDYFISNHDGRWYLSIDIDLLNEAIEEKTNETNKDK